MNKIYDKDVDFSCDKTITEIPEGTVFNGNANFYDCTSLTTIPKSVIKNCKGTIYLPKHLNPNPSNVRYEE